MKVIRVLAIGFTLLCQVYGLLIGLTFLTDGMPTMSEHGSLIYMLGYPKQLPFSHFNPALGYLCFGWGIAFSTLDRIYRQTPDGKFMLFGLVFGIANLSVGILNLFGLGVGFGLPTSGILGIFFGLFLTYTIGCMVMSIILVITEEIEPYIGFKAYMASSVGWVALFATQHSKAIKLVIVELNGSH